MSDLILLLLILLCYKHALYHDTWQGITFGDEDYNNNT